MKDILKVLLLVVLLVLTPNLFANEQKDLEKHFLKKIDEIVLIVSNKKLSKQERNSKVVDVLIPMFDFELMAKLSLGKVYKTLSKEDRQKFIQLYVKRMETSYSSKLDSYDNQKIQIIKVNQPKSNRMVLITNLVDKNENLEVLYKFYKPKKQKINKDKWLIYDVEILGVSILKADKAQFKEFLQVKTIYELMDVLVKS